MKPWTTLALVSSIGFDKQGAFGFAFTPSAIRGSIASTKCWAINNAPGGGWDHKSATAVRMESSSGPAEAAPAVAGDGRANPVYRQMVVLAVRSGAAAATGYFKPAEQGSTSAGDKRAIEKTISAHVVPLVDAILSPAPDNENAEAIAWILDSCEEQQTGAGATLALGYLDTVWWLPAPIRPEIGALAILAVYEALRRFGVFTRFGAVKLPDTQLVPTGTIPDPIEDMEDMPIFQAAKFEAGARRASYFTLIFAFLVSTMSYIFSGCDGNLAWSGMLLLTFAAFEREVLHSALYNEVIMRLQPMLTLVTSAHEAGHIAAAYLTGLPVATYTLGGLGSLQHGDEVGCGPSCNIINAELRTARIWVPDELFEGPEQTRLDSLMTYPWEDSTRSPNPLNMDFSSLETPGKDRVPPFDVKGRYSMTNRMALTSMGGIAGERMAHGFDVGGGADYINMRLRFKGLWPYMSKEDLRTTEQWAFIENLRIFTAERPAMELLAKNMRERRSMGRLMLELDRALTAKDLELSAIPKS